MSEKEEIINNSIEGNTEVKSENTLDYLFPLLLAFFCSAGFVIRQFYRLNTKNMECHGSDILCRLEFYNYYIFPSFIIIGFLSFLLMQFYSRQKFIIINSCYSFFLLVSVFSIAQILLTLAYGGLGHAPILKTFPVNFLLSLLICITTKYSMFNILFFGFWTLLFMFFKKHHFNRLKMEHKFDKATLILLISIIFLGMLFAISLDRHAMVFFLSMIITVLALSWNYSLKNPMLNKNRIFFLIFLIITFWPLIHSFITDSKILTSFIYI